MGSRGSLYQVLTVLLHECNPKMHVLTILYLNNMYKGVISLQLFILNRAMKYFFVGC